MVTFDATLPGTSANQWQAALADQSIAEFDLDGVEQLVVVSAHPDDETLAAGGLMATAAQRGIAVHVIIVTDGAASHPDSATHSPADLARLRAREAFEAIAIVAPKASLSLLGYPDGQVREHRDAIEADLRVELARSSSRAIVLTPWRGDGHRDHRVVGELVARAAADLHRPLLEYPVWMWHWGTPDTVPITDATALTLDPHALRAKRRAIAAHATQVQPLSDLEGDEAILTAQFLEHFDTPRELFFRNSALGKHYFDNLYAKRADPWRLATRWYEKRKRAITVASLPAQRYGRALEIGCSIGMLTADLAGRCDSLLAIDVAEAAVRAARERVPGNVTVEQRDATSAYPNGEFDLVVLSEVGYYLSQSALARLLEAIVASLSATGVLVACHWRHPVDDYLLSGDAVHAAVGELSLHRLSRHEEADFVLEVFGRSSRSVAEREGLA